MLLETLSVPLSKAFSVNSVQNALSLPLLPIRSDEPGTQTQEDTSISSVLEGFFPPNYAPGAVQANRILVLPYCDGFPMQFALRLYGWRLSTGPGRLWFRLPLCQLYCVSSDIPGLGPDYQLLKSEMLCDTISLVAGSLGYGGEIVSFSQGWPAYALIDLKGCQKIQFEFEQIDPVSMNAFWARC